jgi:hypothetical protein
VEEFIREEFVEHQDSFEVLCVQVGESEEEVFVENGLPVMKSFLEEKVPLGYRLMLLTQGVSPRLLNGLGPLDPEWIEPSWNQVVHGILELASEHADIRVERVSEKAAFFLEESVKSGVDGELVALVVLGLKRSKGRVLRFRDLLPHFHRYFEPGDDAERV